MFLLFVVPVMVFTFGLAGRLCGGDDAVTPIKLLFLGVTPDLLLVLHQTVEEFEKFRKVQKVV